MAERRGGASELIGCPAEIPMSGDGQEQSEISWLDAPHC